MRSQGLVLGGSSGAALAAAREIASAEPEATVAAVACDGGEQYFDTVYDAEWLAERGFETR